MRVMQKEEIGKYCDTYTVLNTYCTHDVDFLDQISKCTPIRVNFKAVKGKLIQITETVYGVSLYPTSYSSGYGVIHTGTSVLLIYDGVHLALVPLSETPIFAVEAIIELSRAELTALLLKEVV